MPPETSPEIFWLTLTAALTALLWLPYIVNQIARMGLWGALRTNDPAGAARASWAVRAAAAHRNAVENLVVFAPLALAVHVTGAGTQATAATCMVYFLARAGHYVVYLLGIPVVRTVLFAVGVICQLQLARVLLGW